MQVFTSRVVFRWLLLTLTVVGLGGGGGKRSDVTINSGTLSNANSDDSANEQQGFNGRLPDQAARKKAKAQVTISESVNVVKSGGSKNSKVKVDAKLAKALEAHLLNLFGLEARPRPRPQSPDSSHVPIVPQYMLDLYERHQRLNSAREREKDPMARGGRIANIVRSYIHTESKENSRFLANTGRFRLLFNISQLPLREQLLAAELRLFVHNPQTTFRIEVYDIVGPTNWSSTADDEDLVRLIDTRLVKAKSRLYQNVTTHEEGTWESLDVLPAVVRWRREAKRNHGLLIRLSESDPGQHTVRLRRNIHEGSPSSRSDRTWVNQRPLLVTYSEDGNQSSDANGKGPQGKKGSVRDRRSTKDKENRGDRRERGARGGSGGRRRSGNSGHKDHCRRQTLTVDFSDVGWNDWIVAPTGYEAYYCHGECQFPLADHLNSTNHAIVQTLVNSVKPSAVPGACCVPTQLSAISMLYLDEYDKVVLKNYQDMVVEGCGCR